MKTDDLITLLSADPRPGRAVFPDVLFAALGPILVTGSLLVMALGVRPDLSSALAAPVTLSKWLLPAVLFAAGMALARIQSRPEAQPRAGWWVAALVAVAAVALMIARGTALPATDWPSAVWGHTRGICLASITGIGLSGLIGGLAVLRRGATTRPGLSGLALGLASGAAATVLYAVHCGEDDPLFFVTWYGLSILILGVLGAMSGRRWLRM
jgi:hypothetical protein